MFTADVVPCFLKLVFVSIFLWINSSTFLPLSLPSYFIREKFSSVPGLLSQIPLSLKEFQGGNTLVVQNSYGMLKQFFTFKSLKITEDRLNLHGDCRCVILVPNEQSKMLFSEQAFKLMKADMKKAKKIPKQQGSSNLTSISICLQHILFSNFYTNKQQPLAALLKSIEIISCVSCALNSF